MRLPSLGTGLLCILAAGTVVPSQQDREVTPPPIVLTRSTEQHADEIVRFGRAARKRNADGRDDADQDLASHGDALRSWVTQQYPNLDDAAIEEQLATPKFARWLPRIRAVEVARRIVAFGPEPTAEQILSSLRSRNAVDRSAAFQVLADEPELARALLPRLEDLLLESLGVPMGTGDSSPNGLEELSQPAADQFRIEVALAVLELPVDPRVEEIALLQLLDLNRLRPDLPRRERLIALQRIVDHPAPFTAVRFRILTALNSTHPGERLLAAQALVACTPPPPDERTLDRRALVTELRRIKDPARRWVIHRTLQPNWPTDRDAPAILRGAWRATPDPDARKLLEGLLDAWDPGWRDR